MTLYQVVGGTYRDDVYRLDSAFEFDVSLNARAHESSPGGPGLCLAVALRRLGADVLLDTVLGDGPDSRAALEVLAAEGVRVRARHSPGPLDHSVTLIDAGLDSVVATHRSQPRPVLDRVDPGADVVLVCSPTVLRGLAARLEGRRIVLHPHAQQCRELCALPRQERAALLGAVDLLVVNEHEYDLIAPLPEIGAVPALVVTRGPRGSTLLTADGARVERPASPTATPPVNTNGAGEAFTAALLAARDAGHDWPRALELAADHAGRHVAEAASLGFPRTRIAAPIHLGAHP